MRIRTQFIITMLLFAVVLVAISVSALLTDREVQKAYRQSEIADSIAHGADTLGFLAIDYLNYLGSAQLERWNTSYNAFSSDVNSLVPYTPEQKTLVENIKANSMRMKDVFDSVVNTVRTSQGTGGTLNQELLRDSWSRLETQSTVLTADAGRLAILLIGRVNQIQQTNEIAVFVLVGIFAAYFVATILLVQTRALRGIAQLQEGATIIGSGNLDHKLKETHNNEIGDLARAFNKMTTDLKEVTATKDELEREIRFRTIAETELRANEEKYRSLNLSMNEGVCLHEMILDPAGNAVDYKILDCNPAYELITKIPVSDAIGRNATELYGFGQPPYLQIYSRVASTGRPESFETYFPPMDKYFAISVFSPARGQFATVFTDISDRKKAEAALRASEQRWAATLSSIGDAVISTDIEGKITFLNRVAEQLTGWLLIEAAGRHISEVFHIINEKTRNLVENPVERVLAKGDVVGLANHTILVRKDGSELPIDDSGSPIKNQDGAISGVVLIFRDITQRKKDEAEIRHLASFPEANLNPVIELERSGNILYMNLASQEKYPNLAGNIQTELIKEWDELAKQAMASDSHLASTEIQYGASWYSVSVSYLPQAGLFRIYARDITTRIDAQRQVMRINMELRAISDCNQAIVHATDETTLFNDVCRIICDTVGFPHAWVGIVEYDENKSIRPVAVGGKPDADLLKDSFTWADTERGRNATGTAVRTGKTSVFKDLLSPDGPLAWRHKIEQRGLRSGIAMPLFDAEGTIFAVFAVFASEPDAFSTADIKLLEELSTDLAFGISTLRIREERVKTLEIASRRNTILQAINRILVESVTCDTEHDLQVTSLHVLLEITGSKIGFIGEVGADGFLHDTAMSSTVWEQCNLVDKKGQLRVSGSFKIHGLYGQVLESGRSLLTNSPQSHPSSVGTPAGHPPIDSFLGVPLFQNNRVTGMVGLGNRQGGFRPEDVEIVETIAPAIVEATMRKRTEVELRQAYEKISLNEQRLERSQQMAHLGSWELDLENNVLTWSDEVYRIFGLEPQEFKATYEAFLERVHPEDRARVDAAYTNSIKNGSDGYEIEHSVLQKSTGETRIVRERCHHIKDKSGKVFMSIGMVHDITEQKMIEGSLRETRDFLDSLIDHANAPIVVWGPSSEIIRFNHAFERLTGFTSEQIIGKKVDFLFSDNTKLVDSRHAQESMETFWDAVEIPVKDKEGNTHVLLWNSATIHGPDEKTVLATIAQGQDITERKQVEVVKDEFIGMVSHELKTPLTVVIGALAVARSEEISRQEADSLILDAVMGAESMNRLVDNLLELSRFHQKRLSLQTAFFDINNLVKDVTAKLSTKSQIHNIVLEMPAEIPPVMADETRIERVLHNLIDNAIKYSPRGGETKVFGYEDGNELVIGVKDHGMGISKKEQGRLFGSFERLGGAYENHTIPGLGLGLRVCRILVEAHGGRIWMESKEGKGSTFYFSMPVKRDPTLKITEK